MDEDKRAYCEQIEAVLKADPRSHVTAVRYKERYRPGVDRPMVEAVKIEYKGGSVAIINVTHNSLGAILTEVAAEVYGRGAMGRIFKGWEDAE